MSGIILAGGSSSRLGRNKAFIEIGGQRLIDRVISRISEIADSLIIVTNDTDKYSSFADRAFIAKDIVPGLGPLAGLQAGLTASSDDVNLIVSCDAPFLRQPVLSYLVDNIDDADALVPRWDGRVHTLLAVYRKSCLPAITAALSEKRLRLDSFFDDIVVEYTEESSLYSLDPLGASFFNVNTKADASNAERLSETYDKEI